jgi:hypothetical protein
MLALSTEGKFAMDKLTLVAIHVDDELTRSRDSEAVELYNWLENESRFNSNKCREFKRFETEMKWGDFVRQHCEARLMYIANEAAMMYCKQYGGGNYREVFPLQVRVAVARLMANEFIIEKEAGNSWL